MFISIHSITQTLKRLSKTLVLNLIGRESLNTKGRDELYYFSSLSCVGRWWKLVNLKTQEPVRCEQQEAMEDAGQAFGSNIPPSWAWRGALEALFLWLG